MTFLTSLNNPPATQANATAQYQFDNGVFECIDALSFVSNPSILTNANFATLGASGTTPITQADGNDVEFSDEWKVFGAANANYTITPTAYPAGAISGSSPSTIQTSSAYYINVEVTSHNGNDFYFYQRHSAKIRYYQRNFLTYGVWIRNNQSKAIKIRMEYFALFDPASDTQQDNSIFLQPGLNKFSSTLKTISLNGQTIGASPYAEFRLRFVDLIDGTADIDIYQIKCEFGKITTPLGS